MYYAYYNDFGVGAVDEYGGRIGIVHVFNHKSSRDAWVNIDTYKREKISSREARELICCKYSVYHNFDSYERRNMPIDVLITYAVRNEAAIDKRCRYMVIDEKVNRDDISDVSDRVERV